MMAGLSDALLQPYLHPCDGPGVLAALTNQLHKAQAQGLGDARSPSGSGSRDPAGATAAGQARLGVGGAQEVPVPVPGSLSLAGVTASERQLLRSFFLQESGLAALRAQPGLLATLKGLPLYRLAAPDPDPDPGSDSDLDPESKMPDPKSVTPGDPDPHVGSAAAAARAPSDPVPEPEEFTDLLSPAVFLSPGDVDVEVGLLRGLRLYVVADSEAQGRLMAAHLGVRSPTAAEVYRHHVLAEQVRLVLQPW